METFKVVSPILVDTALLGRGLSALDNNIIKYLWPSNDFNLPYCYEGEIKHLKLDEMLKLRNREEIPRIDAEKLEDVKINKQSGYLTGSALINIAKPSNVVVTAGIGGITGDRLSNDLITIAHKPICFISSGFKDIVDAKSSLEYLKAKGLKVLGWESPAYDGFLFNSTSYLLDGVVNESNWEDIDFSGGYKGVMIFNPLPKALRINEVEILATIKEDLYIYQKQQLDFHPIINQLLDKYTDGRASFIQLLALIANLNLARKIIDY